MIFRFISIFLFSFLVSPLHAASFDCSKATTETEKAICADPELSALDESIAKEFFALDKKGRYFDDIVTKQKEWIRKNRKLSSYDFKHQLEFLVFANQLNSCSKGKRTRFKNCLPDLIPFLNLCGEKENYTTVVMNRCSSSYLDLLVLVEGFETDLFKKIQTEDEETVALFDKAYQQWQTFVRADCDWQYSQYRSGTKRHIVWFACAHGHYENRITLLNGLNRHQGMDRDYVKD